MPSTSGPLGDAPDVSVGFSDTFLVGVSLVGFVALAGMMYSIVLTRLKTAQEIEEEDMDGELNYNDRLVRADVATLSRAERRARARHIMKQQRRRQVPGENEADNDGGPRAIQPQEDADGASPQNNALSRKERQKAAKAAEKEQRKLFDEERLRQQAIAQREAQLQKQEREKIQAERREIEKAGRKAREQREEMERYEAWNSFIAAGEIEVDDEENRHDDNDGDDDDDGNSSNRNSKDDNGCLDDDRRSKGLSLQSFVERCRADGIIQTDELAAELNVSVGRIHDRIDELIASKRVSGMLDAGTCRFAHLTQGQLSSIAQRLEQMDTLALQNVLDVAMQEMRS